MDGSGIMEGNNQDIYALLSPLGFEGREAIADVLSNILKLGMCSNVTGYLP